MLPGVARPPPGACGRGPGRSWPPGLAPPGWPPGRGAAGPGRGDCCGRAMPVEPLVVKGLLPGRGPAGRPPGLAPPGLAPLGFGAPPPGLGPGLVEPPAGPPPALGALGRGAAGAPLLGRGPAGFDGAASPVGWVNSGAAGRGLAPGFGPAGRGAPGRGAGAGAAPAGLGAAGLGVSAPGLGAAGLAALAPGLAGFLPPPLPNASVSLRTTGASMVEDAERTNSPSSWSLAITTLLSTPSSLASSYTRTLATSLLIRSGVGRPPDLRYFTGVLIAYSSSAHRNLDLLPTREVPDRADLPRGSSYCSVWPTMCRSSPVSSGPSVRKARGNARRRTASSRQAGVGCTYAPRPGSVPRRSGTQRSPVSATRSKPSRAERCRHPTHVRSGQGRAHVRPDTIDSTSPYPPCSGRGRSRCSGARGAPVITTPPGTTAHRPAAFPVAVRPGRPGQSPAASGSGSVSERMSMRQPVSRAASRAFCPSLPMANDSW